MRFLKIKQTRKTAIRGDRENDILNNTKTSAFHTGDSLNSQRKDNIKQTEKK